MNFLFDDEQEMLRGSMRSLLGHQAPAAEIRRLLDTDTGFSADLWRRAADLGTLSMLVDERHGGGSLTGQGLVDATLLAEEWGRALAPGPFVSAQLALLALSTTGSPAQQQLLPALVAGERVATWCLAEETGGWDVTAMRCRATRQADGWHLDGDKLFVEAAPVADLLVVAAASDQGPVQLLVPVGTPGVAVQPHRSMDLTRRTYAVQFRDVSLPPDAQLPGADAAALATQLRVGAVLTCADSIGGAQRVLDMTVAYTKQREQFGRRIASFQAVKHRCADLLILLEGARAATHYAALAADAALSAEPASATQRVADAALAVSLAKAYVGDAYATITGEGTQLHGGIAFTWDYDMHLFVRRAKANEVLFGTPAWHRGHSWAALTRGPTENSER